LVFGKLPCCAQVVSLYLLSKLAHQHVFDHPLAQRADARHLIFLVFFHSLFQLEIEVGLPYIRHWQLPADANLIPSRNANYR